MALSNTFQVLEEIKARLLSQEWTGSSNKVFHPGSVLITVGVDDQALSTMVSPICLIRPLEATSDPVGENTLMGGNKTGGDLTSLGRGLFEIEEELLNAIKVMNALEGVLIQS